MGERDPVAMWLRQNRTAVKNALRDLGIRGQELPDVAATEPTRLVDVVAKVSENARAENAPAEITQALHSLSETMRSKIPSLDDYGYTLTKLRELKGERHGKNIAAALKAAAEEAPDELNREKLSQMVLAVEERLRKDKPNEPSTERMSECAACCTFLCMMCFLETAGGGCLICCIAGCIMC